MLGENVTGQTGVKRPRRWVTKGLVAEAAPAAKRPEKAERPGETRGTSKLTPDAGDPGEREKCES